VGIVGCQVDMMQHSAMQLHQERINNADVTCVSSVYIYIFLSKLIIMYI
jgi:hypothetical protein